MCFIAIWNVFLINDWRIAPYMTKYMKEIWKCLYIIFKYDFCIKI